MNVDGWADVSATSNEQDTHTEVRLYNGARLGSWIITCAGTLTLNWDIRQVAVTRA